MVKQDLKKSNDGKIFTYKYLRENDRYMIELVNEKNIMDKTINLIPDEWLNSLLIQSNKRYVFLVLKDKDTNNEYPMFFYHTKLKEVDNITNFDLELVIFHDNFLETKTNELLKGFLEAFYGSLMSNRYIYLEQGSPFPEFYMIHKKVTLSESLFYTTIKNSVSYFIENENSEIDYYEKNESLL